MTQPPPYNQQAEQAVIGAMIKNKMVIPDVTEILTASDFYEERNVLAYQAIVDLEAAGVTPDLLAVSENLRKDNKIDFVTVVYLAEMVGQVATTATVTQHAKIVRECSVLRQLISKSSSIISKAYDRNFDNIEDFISQAEADILELNSKQHSGGLVPVKSLIMAHLQDMENRKPGITGIKTPWDDLNYMTNGLQRSDLIIIAGRPSMGKTSCGVQLACGVALKGGHVAIFSLESKKERILDKMIMQQAKIDGQRMRIGSLSERDWSMANHYAGELYKSSLHIDDNSNVTVMDIRSRCRRMKQKTGLDLVVIDYLGLINPHKKAENRSLEIGFMTKALKGLAKELDVPVVLLCQLNRQVSGRANKKPQLTDLRESGNIEQDADVVMFVHREEYYTPDTEKKGIAELVIAKQREGPTGIVEVAFLKECTAFVGLSIREVESSAG